MDAEDKEALRISMYVLGISLIIFYPISFFLIGILKEGNALYFCELLISRPLYVFGIVSFLAVPLSTSSMILFLKEWLD